MDFPEMEKKWLKHWQNNGVIEKYLHKNAKAKKYFSFLDGPITANNPMGIHHAWGRTYKDLWQKFYNLLGYRERFQNGFDCQGLWVEVEVEKELKLKNKKEIEELVPGDRKASIAKFVQLCKDRVMKFSAIQANQSKRLGYFMDWEHSYFTMSGANNYMIWFFLKKCYENGWIYKGHESVPWCPRCETAISQHEMLTEDYKELVHESIYFKFRLANYELKKTFLLVWTTTPWTIPANIAVAIDETFDYSLVEKSGDNYWILADLVKNIFEKDYKVLKTVKGKELVGLKYEGPFDNLPAVAKAAKKNPKTFHTVIATDEQILPISKDEGTGMVHTAVSAGAEDFKLGKKLGLPMIPVIADDASYLEELGFLSGKNAKKNPRLILDYMQEGGFAFKIHNYKHRYPACWRCKTELVWKVADEWYISMDKKFENKTLRQRMVSVAKKINWLPEFGLDRELDWLKNMHDWLISKKNRYWGLALPIYECKKCKNFEVIGSKEELKKRAVKGWDKFAGHTPHKPYIDEVEIKCNKCGEAVKRIDDVGNPWLDAGIVSYSTISENNQGEPLYFKNKNEWRKWFPADFITESFPGQFKNWFYALIAESTVLENENPFKTVLGFGTMLDETGKPFHKSLGNAIEFVEGADRFGADIIRWVCISEDPANNILFGDHKTRAVMRQFYLILWNVYQFYIEYRRLDKFVSVHPKGVQAVNVLDKWILSRFVWLVGYVEQNLKQYNAKNASLEIEKFVSDLSIWYLRRSRDRVWVNSEDQTDKNNFYSTLHYVLVNLAIVLSPFMPFLPEEIYTNLTGKESVHLANWPVVDSYLYDKNLEEEMLDARKQVEASHAVRKTQNIKVRIPVATLKIDISETVPVRDGIYEIVLKEINAKNLENKTRRYPKKEIKVSEAELKKEGELRDLIREIQSQRKELGIKPDVKAIVTVPEKFKAAKNFLLRRVYAESIHFGDKVKVEV